MEYSGSKIRQLSGFIIIKLLDRLNTFDASGITGHKTRDILIKINPFGLKAITDRSS